MKDWNIMNTNERVEYMLNHYSTRGEGRYGIFYNEKMLWFGNRSTFKTEGIARRMLNENISRSIIKDRAKARLDELIEDGTIKIKQL